MEATKRKHYDETEIDDPETASLWFFNPSSLKNQSIDINKNKFLIGRGTDVDLQVTSPRISRAHCLIQTVGTLGAPKWELVDKNSTMGTYLNGRRVQAEKPTPLKDGDVIYLSDPDVYPIRFVTSGGSAPAKVSKPGPASTDYNDVIVIHDLSEDFKRKTETNDKIVKAVIDLTSSDHSDLQVLNKPSIGLFEGTSAKSCDNIISNTSTKPKLISNSIADKENNVNEDSKPKASELNQKLQDQQQEIERLRAELKNKDEEMSRLSKDKEILKFIEETNKEIMKNLNDDLYAMKEELERCQESNSEVAVMLKTTKTFIDLIEAELQCSICNEVIVTASIVMPCFHVFCNACISLWFRQKQECAVCRTPAQVSVPCKMLDSFVDKLMEITPDADYRQKRRQICQERRAQEPPPVAHPPPPPRVGAPPAAHQARHVLHNPYGQMLMEVIIGGGGGAQMMANEEGLMIDLTVQDMAAHNVAAAAARAYNANPVARPRTRRGRGHRAN